MPGLYFYDNDVVGARQRAEALGARRARDHRPQPELPRGGPAAGRGAAARHRVARHRHLRLPQRRQQLRARDRGPAGHQDRLPPRRSPGGWASLDDDQLVERARAAACKSGYGAYLLRPARARQAGSPARVRRRHHRFLNQMVDNVGLARASVVFNQSVEEGGGRWPTPALPGVLGAGRPHPARHGRPAGGRRRDGRRAGGAVRRDPAGGLQAPQGARGCRPGQPDAATRSAARATSRRRCST